MDPRSWGCMHECVRMCPLFKDCTEDMGERDGFVRAVMLEDLAEDRSGEGWRTGGRCFSELWRMSQLLRRRDAGRASTVLCLVSGRLGDSHPFLTQSHVSILG